MMSTPRMITGFVLAFAFGSFSVGLLLQWRTTKEMDAVQETARKIRLATQENFDKREATLLAEIEKLKQDLFAARETAGETVQATPDSANDSPAITEEPEPSLSQESVPEQEAENRDRGRRGRWEDLSDAEREAMMEQRREFMADTRERINTFLGDRMLQSNDPLEQERMAALQEYVAYMADLRTQMHEAKTDEEREAVAELMRSTGEEMRGIMRDQQTYLLQGIASEYGITDAQKQAEFANQIQELRHDPFFNNPMMGDGPMGGGPGPGGFGGFPGPGRGPDGNR